MLNRLLLLFVTVKVNVCELSLAGPLLKFVAQLVTVCAPKFLSIVWSAPFVKLGGSLTAVIEIVNAFVVVSLPPFAVPPESCKVTVTVVVPFSFAAGV